MRGVMRQSVYNPALYMSPRGVLSSSSERGGEMTWSSETKYAYLVSVGTCSATVSRGTEKNSAVNT